MGPCEENKLKYNPRTFKPVRMNLLTGLKVSIQIHCVGRPVDNSVSDRELIVQLQRGELPALGLLYDRHRHMVFRTALAIAGDREVAADLLQDVFLRLHRFVDRVDIEMPLEPWLYRMTANLSYTWVKRQNRWLRPLEDLAEWLLAGGHRSMPHQLTDQSDDIGQIQQALQLLPLAQRMVVVLYYVNDLSVQEIAEIIDVPVGTVKSRLHYGRQTLKDALEKQGRVVSEVQYEFT
jgi:RNA polymerase sigma-70 factor, ECF subfamily